MKSVSKKLLYPSTSYTHIHPPLAFLFHQTTQMLSGTQLAVTMLTNKLDT